MAKTIPLTYKSIEYIVKNYDLKRVRKVSLLDKNKNQSGNGAVLEGERVIEIKMGLSREEEDTTMFHEFLHVHYDEIHKCPAPESQVEREARKYFRTRPDILEYYHSFK